MKLNLSLCIFILVVITYSSMSSRVSKVEALQPIKADSSSAAVSNGNTVAATSDASSAAKTGHTAVGASISSAASDTVETNTNIVAVSEAGKKDKLVTSTAHQEAVAQSSTGQEGDAYKRQIDSEKYTTDRIQKTAFDGSVSTQKNDQYVTGQNKLLVNDDQTISTKTQRTASTASLTGSIGVLDEQSKSEFIITINSDNEEFIIERIIGNSQQVLIVSGARLIKPSLGKSDISALNSLITGTCNCKKVKDYVLELIAEA